MCLPKAPKEDPAVKAQREAARQREQERIEEEKKKQLGDTKRQLGGTGIRSLISSGGGGFGSNV